MRVVMLTFLLVFSSISIAQMPAGMQEAMECMQSLDQDALKDMGTRGEAVSNEIKALCKKGDESEALEVAMTYVKEISDSEVVEELKRCSELMRKAMPSMPIPEIPSAEMYENEADSICDNID